MRLQPVSGKRYDDGFRRLESGDRGQRGGACRFDAPSVGDRLFQSVSDGFLADRHDTTAGSTYDVEHLILAGGFGDGDPFGPGRCGGKVRAVSPSVEGGTFFGLNGDELRDARDSARGKQVIEPDPHADEEGTVSRGDHDAIRLAAELVYDFVGERFRAVEEKRVPDVAGIELPFGSLEGGVRGVLARSRNAVEGGAVGLDLGQLGG